MVDVKVLENWKGEMIDNNTFLLFSPFNRNVGNPYQFAINSQKDFEDFLIRNSGLNDCSASVYADDGVIDKIWFDFDGDGAIEEAKKLYDYLKFLECKVIPVISGKKGIHLHLLVSSTLPVNDYETRVKLMDACQSIISNGLGIKDWKQKTSLDWSKVGAIKSTCRIPNTLRPPGNTTWCSYLPENWSELSNNDIWDYSKSPHSFEYTGEVYNLAFFIDKNSSELFKPRQRAKGTYATNSIIYDSNVLYAAFAVPKNKKELTPFLEQLMRPCLFRHIFRANPGNDVRVATTIDLVESGLSVNQILEIYSMLDWENYNEGITKEKVEYIADRIHNNDLNAYSCSKLRFLQIPRLCCYD